MIVPGGIARTRAAARRRDRLVAVTAAGLTGLAILAILVVAVHMTQPVPAPASRSAAGVLAVLPFEALEPDPNTSHFGIGLAESIVNHVSRIPGLTVRPMSAPLTLASGITDPIEAGRRLEAGVVMVGHYSQAKQRIRVTAQLLDVGTGFTLWGHAFQSSVTELAEVEKVVVSEALAVLMPDLRTGETVKAASGGPRDPTAHYLYVLARGKMATLLTGVIPEVVQLLEEAIRKDPDFAPAHAQLSIASANMFLGGLSSDRGWIERALAAGRRAVYLDEREPESHLALGYALMCSGDTVGTMRETLRALQLDPENPEALRMLGMLLAGAGVAGPIRALRDQAVRLDPSMEMGWLDVHLAAMEGTIDRTAAELRREIERRRASGRSAEVPVFNLAYLAFETGHAAQGLHWAAMLENVSASPVYADMARLLALARAGDAPGVSRIIEKHRDSFSKDWEYSGWIGRALAMVGRHEEALEWLQRSARLGSYQVHALDRCDELDPLRGDPRFQEMLSTVRDRAQEIARLAAFAGYR